MEGALDLLVTFIIGITNPDPADHVTRESRAVEAARAAEPPATRVQNTINGASLFCSSTLFCLQVLRLRGGVDVLGYWTELLV